LLPACVIFHALALDRKLDWVSLFGKNMKSLLKTPVAVVRNILDQTVYEFAELLGCSIWTVRQLEKGGMPLSAKLARKIQDKTAAPSEWLLRNDPSIPPADASGLIWSKKVFDVHQGRKESAEVAHTLFGSVIYRALPKEERQRKSRLTAEYLAAKARRDIHASLANAITLGEDEFDTAVLRLNKFIRDLQKVFGCDMPVSQSHAKEVALAAHASSRDTNGRGQEILFAVGRKNYRVRSDGKVREFKIRPTSGNSPIKGLPSPRILPGNLEEVTAQEIGKVNENIKKKPSRPSPANARPANARRFA
jgi:hypothetical protein